MISVGIRGAGVAGLSFAQALLRHVPGISISLFDLRARTPHPTRTFCFFKDSSTPALPPVEHQWDSVVFAGTNFRRVIDCSATPYTLIKGDDFFTSALNEVEAAGAQLSWEHRSIDISERTITVDSTPKRFDLVVDAAFDPYSSSAKLWQSFAGIWVRSKRPLFDHRSALLMDLAVPESSGSVRFIYLLPTSPNTALVEHTTFSRQPRPEQEHLALCQEWIERQGYTELEVTASEYGRIPMGLSRLPTRDETLYRLGTISGAVRASTGYAFINIRKQTEQLALALATSLSRGASLPASLPKDPIPLWSRYADDIFLKALARSPALGQGIMSELLRRAPERDLVPFLSGSASMASGLRVITSVPKLNILKALWGQDA